MIEMLIFGLLYLIHLVSLFDKKHARSFFQFLSGLGRLYEGLLVWDKNWGDPEQISNLLRFGANDAFLNSAPQTVLTIWLELKRNYRDMFV